MWQQFYEAHAGGESFELLTVALDAQGQSAARPYLERAGATYRAVVDRDNSLGALFGFKAIPHVWLLDEVGVLRFQQLGFHIGRQEQSEALLKALAVPPTEARALDTAAWRPERGVLEASAALLAQGRKRAALEQLIAAYEADPENFVIRKQVWYLLHPERFTPEIDTKWQREQIARERELGFGAANPIPADF